MDRGTCTAILTAFSLLSVASAGTASTWHVDVAATPPGLGTAQAPYSSIKYAIDQPTTQSGDTLLIAPGAYEYQLTGQPSPFPDLSGKGLTLQSTHGPTVTRIVKTGYGPSLCTIPPSQHETRIVGITFASGDAPGGALNVTGSRVIIEDCVFENCTGYHLGGAVLATSSIVEFRSCRFERCGGDCSSISFCRTDRGGGVYAVASRVSLIDCEFIETDAFEQGGCLYLDGCSVRIIGCLFENARVLESSGAGAFLTNCHGVIEDSTFKGGYCHGLGGGVGAVDSTLSIRGCTFADNTGEEGGGVAITGGSANIDGCVFRDNISDSVVPGRGNGGGLSVGFAGTVTVHNSLFTGNVVKGGGGTPGLGGAVNPSVAKFG